MIGKNKVATFVFARQTHRKSVEDSRNLLRGGTACASVLSCRHVGAHRLTRCAVHGLRLARAEPACPARLRVVILHGLDRLQPLG